MVEARLQEPLRVPLRLSLRIGLRAAREVHSFSVSYDRYLGEELTVGCD